MVNKFRMCQTNKGNNVLRENLAVSLSILYSNIPYQVIEDVQVTGSIAYGEGTVIFGDSEVIASDIDLIATVKLPYYLLSFVNQKGQKVSRRGGGFHLY